MTTSFPLPRVIPDAVYEQEYDELWLSELPDVGVVDVWLALLAANVRDDRLLVVVQELYSRGLAPQQ